MLFAIRRVLTPDQWKKVQTMVRRHRAMMDRRGWGDRGPGQWRGRPDGAGPGGPPPGNGQPAPPPPDAQSNQ